MPILCSRKDNNTTQIPKKINFQSQDSHSISNFVSAINNINFTTFLDTDVNADPNANYNKLKKTISTLLQTHSPFKTVKFNRYKHRLNLGYLMVDV